MTNKELQDLEIKLTQISDHINDALRKVIMGYPQTARQSTFAMACLAKEVDELIQQEVDKHGNEHNSIQTEGDVGGVP